MFSDKPETSANRFSEPARRRASCQGWAGAFLPAWESHNKSHRIHTSIIFTHSYTHSLTLHTIHEIAVVAQYYEADVNKEHVIRGNSAVIKCLIPSFVADFVEVVSWHTDQDENYFPGTEYGAIQHQQQLQQVALCTRLRFRLTTKTHGTQNERTISHLNSISIWISFPSYYYAQQSSYLLFLLIPISRFAALWRGYTQGVCHTRQFGHFEVWYTIVCSRFCKCYIVAYRSGREFLSRYWIWCVQFVCLSFLPLYVCVWVTQQKTIAQHTLTHTSRGDSCIVNQH